ncbi:MAG TPA: hypothetical protein VML94_01195 [Thermoplasmata archaeon]|nr:hypothetical protein [Thermoplasmata archaeon]
MAAPEPRRAAPDWATTVQVEEEPSVAAEIQERVARGSGLKPVSVTDLLAPRRAYWRRVAPAAPIPELRRDRMETGRSWHTRLAEALPDEGSFEVRVRKDGIAGRIDLLSEVPVEVKTGSPVEAERILDLRPEHVEQIAMYCALTQARTGRIVTLSPGAEGAVSVGAVDLSVPDPVRVAEAMQRRAEAIRTAVRTGRPADLPACRWFGRRCEFQEARRCDCAGTEPSPSREILDRVESAAHRPEIEERWSAALRSLPPLAEGPTCSRFRDLIYPRRAYFEATAPTPPAAPEPARPAAEGPGWFERVVEAVEGGPVGEVVRLPPRHPGPEEDVPGFRGRPFLVRTSKAWSRLRPLEAVGRFPQYALELGFRCATTGTAEGRVVLAYERAEKETDRFQVLRYRFGDPGLFRALWKESEEQLRTAIAAGSPASLPPCPGWMFDGCPYRATCGCGPAEGRSQR